MKNVLLACSASLLIHHANAQFTRYIVKFKDKNGTPYTLSNPLAYLSQRSIDRRVRYGLSVDSTDLPVNPTYITEVKNVPNVILLNISKWLNAVTIQTTDANALTTINNFSFVKSAAQIAARMNNPQSSNLKFENNFSTVNSSIVKSEQANANYYNYGNASFNEIHLHNGEFLHNIGLRGKGMQIAILDNGFNNYTSSAFTAFDSVNANNQVLGTWDFVAREQNVANDGNHGMSCFSIIAANIPGQFVGKAPQASFWLFQTEDNSSEYPIEEVNWACGAERADSSGADVITTSLGYTVFDSASLDHSYADMDGNTTMAAIAADLAAKKGILVFAANGNDGNDTWHYLSTPADGDSVIAVGAVDANSTIGSLSSYGPSSDGRIKPDIASVGVSAILENASGVVAFGNGTSFATPNIAGLSTCLWQGFPELNNMEIRTALWQSGSISNAPDDRIGYGIPDMKTAFSILLIDFSTSSGVDTNCKATLNWTTKDVSSMRYEIERKAFGESSYSKIKDVAAEPNIAVLATHSYQTSDSLINVQAGTVSYRIRQIIDTAAATFTAVYIDTVDIGLASSCITTGINPVNPNNNKISIIPNPAHDQLTLRVETENAILHLSIRIVDMSGHSVLQFERSKSVGAQNFDLPVFRLSKGKYTIAVYDKDHFLLSGKLIKL
ncbi:MAG TPA: S8 family serine peptidase [Chitinophagaceae bacterium]